MKTVITLTIEHKNPIPDLLDKVAGRAYTLDGVDDVTASVELQGLTGIRFDSDCIVNGVEVKAGSVFAP